MVLYGFIARIGARAIECDSILHGLNSRKENLVSVERKAIGECKNYLPPCEWEVVSKEELFAVWDVAL